ncbi:MAG: hypothetical protein MH204_01075, partial [Fimbriimonadaceae bacterium]|nr:hypothetical protein [Fimbriimonadaceae bacterium]
KTEVAKVLAKVKETLNDGQEKSIEGLIPGTWLNREKPDEVTADQKMELWVQNVLMDDLAYQILNDLFRNLGRSE